jgi:hypothetical protein
LLRADTPLAEQPRMPVTQLIIFHFSLPLLVAALRRSSRTASVVKTVFEATTKVEDDIASWVAFAVPSNWVNDCSNLE